MKGKIYENLNSVRNGNDVISLFHSFFFFTLSLFFSEVGSYII